MEDIKSNCIGCEYNYMRMVHDCAEPYYTIYSYGCKNNMKIIEEDIKKLDKIQPPNWCIFNINETINKQIFMNTQEKIDNLLKELSDLSDVKVGDKLYSTRLGELIISGINSDKEYPIHFKIPTGTTSCTRNGLYLDTDISPTLFKKNPYLEIAKLFSEPRDKWMEVSNDGIDWKVRKVISQLNGKYFAYVGACNEDELKDVNDTLTWIHAREIQPKSVELTLKDIAEKFGIDVKQLKIKD